MGLLKRNRKSSCIAACVAFVVGISAISFFNRGSSDPEDKRLGVKLSEPKVKEKSLIRTRSTASQKRGSHGEIVAPSDIDQLRETFGRLRDQYSGRKLVAKKTQEVLDYLNSGNLQHAELYELITAELPSSSVWAILGTFVRTFVQEAPDDALEWLQLQKASPSGNSVISAAAQFFGDFNTDLGHQLLSKYEFESVTRVTFLKEFSIARVGHDFDEGLQLAMELSAEERDEQFYQRFAMIAVRGNDFEQILPRILEIDSGNVSKSSMSALVVELWARSDPEAAGTFLKSRNDSDPALVASLISEWSKTDLMEASKWLVANDSVNGWQAAAGNLASELSKTSPRDALEWANAVSNQEQRLGLLGEIYRSWSDLDPKLQLMFTERLTPEDLRKLKITAKQPQ